MLVRPAESDSWEDMASHEADLIWHTEVEQAHVGEVRCCVDSIGLTFLAFLVLPPADWEQLEREFGAAAMAYRFMALPADMDAFIQSNHTAGRVHAYGPAGPAHPLDPFEASLRSIEATVNKVAAGAPTQCWLCGAKAGSDIKCKCGDAKVRVRYLMSKNKSLQLLVIPNTIVTRDYLHQLPAFRRALEHVRDELVKEKIRLRSVTIEAQEVIERVPYAITPEDIFREGKAPQLRFDHGPWDAVRQLWPFGKR
jgi:hypothetical protein